LLEKGNFLSYKTKIKLLTGVGYQKAINNVNRNMLSVIIGPQNQFRRGLAAKNLDPEKKVYFRKKLMLQ
jgi:hypothetical protein